MAATALKQEIDKELDSLPLEDQRRVLDFTRALTVRRAPGPGKQKLHSFDLGFSKEDLEEMKRAIEEDCEKVRYSWH